MTHQRHDFTLPSDKFDETPSVTCLQNVSDSACLRTLTCALVEELSHTQLQKTNNGWEMTTPFLRGMTMRKNFQHAVQRSSVKLWSFQTDQDIIAAQDMSGIEDRMGFCNMTGTQNILRTEELPGIPEIALGEDRIGA